MNRLEDVGEGSHGKHETAIMEPDFSPKNYLLDNPDPVPPRESHQTTKALKALNKHMGIWALAIECFPKEVHNSGILLHLPF